MSQNWPNVSLNIVQQDIDYQCIYTELNTKMIYFVALDSQEVHRDHTIFLFSNLYLYDHIKYLIIITGFIDRIMDKPIIHYRPPQGLV